MNRSDMDNENEILKRLVSQLPKEKSAPKKKNMKSSKEPTNKRHDIMKNLMDPRRQDRGDRNVRVDKVEEYLKNLSMDGAGNLNDMSDESYSDVEEDKIFKRGIPGGQNKQKKNKAKESSSSSESSGSSTTLSLSDLSLSDEDDDDDDGNELKDPFAKQKSLSKSDKNKRPTNIKLNKPKFEDYNKMSQRTGDDLLNTLMDFDKKANLEKKNKTNADKAAKLSSASAAAKLQNSQMQKQLEKKLNKLAEDQMSKSMGTLKNRKNTKKDSSSSDLSPEEEFYKYLHGAKSNKFLESLGKKVDDSSKGAIERTLAELGKTKASKSAAKSGQSSKKVTEPPRPAPTRKVIAKEALPKFPDVGQKTGATPKMPPNKTKMTISTSDKAKAAAAAATANMFGTSTATRHLESPIKTSAVPTKLDKTESSGKKTVRRTTLKK